MTTPILRRSTIVRVRLLSSKLTLLEYTTEQEQIRQDAPKSAACTPLVQGLLTTWNQSTDKAAALDSQERSLLQQLVVVRQARSQAREQMRLDEVAFVGGATIAASNDPALLKSLGLAIATPNGGPGPRTAPDAPATVTVKPGTDPGGLHIKWTRSLKTRTYQVQLSAEPVTATSWSPLPPQTRRSLKLGDLLPGGAYQVRVAAVGPGGQSVWSQPSRGVAR